mmetsp:Transcript_52337/g.113720  ORF Transcript_52337/g.113720 Transcript_52337/m.113720 type:complete len:90 (-) Transcript_52337:163-432(-)
MSSDRRLILKRDWFVLLRVQVVENALQAPDCVPMPTFVEKNPLWNVHDEAKMGFEIQLPNVFAGIKPTKLKAMTLQSDTENINVIISQT